MPIPLYQLYELTIQVLGRTKREPADRVLETGLRVSRELLARSQAVDVEEKNPISQGFK